jgi:hypothetical protein
VISLSPLSPAHPPDGTLSHRHPPGFGSVFLTTLATLATFPSAARVGGRRFVDIVTRARETKAFSAGFLITTDDRVPVP